jgi:hypothetical protein
MGKWAAKVTELHEDEMGDGRIGGEPVKRHRG